MATEAPLISVVIATYNWSSVLKYAIASALRQTEQRIEVLVIGDGCTDDSEAVVWSFHDDRVRWYNLPENTGSQSMPNNKGIELARGVYIAYHGHNDLWYPTHLETLLRTIEATGADFAYSMCAEIPPEGMDRPRRVSGMSASGVYEEGMFLHPSALMHRRKVIETTGPWRDYRALSHPPDYEFVARAYKMGMTFAPTRQLTVFKFPSALRKNSYVEKPSHEQREYTRRMLEEAEFRYYELLAIVDQPHVVERALYFGHLSEQRAPRGANVEANRAVRGLPQNAPLEEKRPLYENLATLQEITERRDILPAAMRYHLFVHQHLPEDGLFLGNGWARPVFDEWGRCLRWVENDAEIVVTRPTGKNRLVLVEIAPGPSIGDASFTMGVHDASGQRIAEFTVPAGENLISVELPLRAGESGAVFRLHADVQPKPVTDRRLILTFRVHRLEWMHPYIAPWEHENAHLRAELEALKQPAERRASASK